MQTYCIAYPVEIGDELVPRPLLSFKFYVKFIKVPLRDSYTIEAAMEPVDRDRVIRDPSIVRQMLTHLNIPPQEHIIDEIMDVVREMPNLHSYSMRVKIRLVLYVPRIEEAAAADDGFDVAWGGRFAVGPASRDSMDKCLETVGSMRDEICAICTEEINASEAKRMKSCMHIFHGKCIVEWLQRSSVCPLCRAQISPKN